MNRALKALTLSLIAATSMVSAGTMAHNNVTDYARISADARRVGVERIMGSEQFNKVADREMGRIWLLKGTEPRMTITDPRNESVTIIEFAALNPVNDEVVPAKKVHQLKNMVPTRHTIKFSFNKQRDKKLRGYRKTKSLLAASVEDLLVTLGALTVDEYNKVAIVEEYNRGLPMVITAQNREYLFGLQEYLMKHGLKPREEKPALVIELLDNPEAFTAADQAFWSTYFVLRTRKDDGVNSSLKTERDFRSALMAATGSAGYMGQPMTESLLLSIEKMLSDMKSGDLLMMTAILAGGFVYGKVGSQVKTSVEAVLSGLLRQPVTGADGAPVMKDGKRVMQARPVLVNTAIGVGGAVGLYLLYRMLANYTSIEQNEAIAEAADAEELDAQVTEAAAAA